MAEGETACPMESESILLTEAAAASWDVVVGLGANLGAPELQLRGAVQEISRWGERVQLSKLYRSAPVGGPPQPDFLNAALRLLSPDPPRRLLERLLGLELAQGRVRRERWGPRSLDLDILWVAGLELREPGLIIPHPRLRERAFALRPLLDVAPDAVDPGDGRAYARVLAEMGGTGVDAVAETWADLSTDPLPPGMDRPASGW
jgi:2-amino-4-hydroxy-6-hydroxymethyldihydropteridine diphosphokinase